MIGGLHGTLLKLLGEFGWDISSAISALRRPFQAKYMTIQIQALASDCSPVLLAPSKHCGCYK